MQLNNIVVFDFETGSNRKSDTEVIQVAALAINPRNLTIYPGSEFESLMRPLNPDGLQDGALAVNKKTREELAVAPHPKEVWGRFAAWCAQWNYKGKSDLWSLPIAAGHNIIGYDLPILERYCAEYGPTRTEKNGEVVQSLFGRFQYDTMQITNLLSESLIEPRKVGMDYLRKWYDMPKESIANAHDALQDVRDCAAILIKYLSMIRYFSSRTIFEKMFNDEFLDKEKERRKALREKAASRAAGSRR